MLIFNWENTATEKGHMKKPLNGSIKLMFLILVKTKKMNSILKKDIAILKAISQKKQANNFTK